MFADGGQVLAVVLALCWTAAAGYAECVRRGLLVGTAPRKDVLAALGVAVLLFGLQARLGDVVDDRGRGATALDSAAWAAVGHHRTAGLTAVAEVLNVAGGMVALGVLAVLAAGVLLLRGRRIDAALMASAPAAGGLLDLGFKQGYARPRPPEAGRLVEVTGFSLPSGHTLDATIVLGTLAIVLIALLRGRLARTAVALVALGAIAVAGASRVYLGVHWATDVLTGWLLGGAWVAACAALRAMVRTGGAAAAEPDGSGAAHGRGSVALP
jgi:undecaprenyl-diphosphatase